MDLGACSEGIKAFNACLPNGISGSISHILRKLPFRLRQYTWWYLLRCEITLNKEDRLVLNKYEKDVFKSTHIDKIYSDVICYEIVLYRDAYLR